jgi:hypothetical protein
MLRTTELIWLIACLRSSYRTVWPLHPPLG